MICAEADHWTACSEKVKKAIASAATPKEALAAAQVWADRYGRLYASNASGQWRPSDQDRMQKICEKLFDEAIGQYLQPDALLFTLALARYFPTLSATLGYASNIWLTGFYVLLAPSPIANDFTAAKPLNDEITALMRAKLDTFMPPDWRFRYASMVERAFNEAKDGTGKP